MNTQNIWRKRCKNHVNGPKKRCKLVYLGCNRVDLVEMLANLDIIDRKQGKLIAVLPSFKTHSKVRFVVVRTDRAGYLVYGGMPADFTISLNVMGKWARINLFMFTKSVRSTNRNDNFFGFLLLSFPRKLLSWL